MTRSDRVKLRFICRHSVLLTDGDDDVMSNIYAKLIEGFSLTVFERCFFDRLVESLKSQIVITT